MPSRIAARIASPHVSVEMVLVPVGRCTPRTSEWPKAADYADTNMDKNVGLYGLSTQKLPLK